MMELFYALISFLFIKGIGCSIIYFVPLFLVCCFCEYWRNRRYSMFFVVQEGRFPWEKKKKIYVGMTLRLDTFFKILIYKIYKKDIKNLFFEDLHCFFNNLKPGIEYEVKTHQLLINLMRTYEKEEKIKFISEREINKKRLIVEKASLLSLHRIWRKFKCYQAIFIKLENIA